MKAIKSNLMLSISFQVEIQGEVASRAKSAQAK